MTTDIMCCARCGNALKIVCPEHGTEFVPDRRMDSPVMPVRKGERLHSYATRVAHSIERGLELPRGAITRRRTSAVQRGEVLARPGSMLEAILLTLTDLPQTAASVADAIGKQPKAVGVQLCFLAKEGRCTRAGHGKYVRRATP